jgi:hypothetical protein
MVTTSGGVVPGSGVPSRMDLDATAASSAVTFPIHLSVRWGIRRTARPEINARHRVRQSGAKFGRYRATRPLVSRAHPPTPSMNRTRRHKPD